MPKAEQPAKRGRKRKASNSSAASATNNKEGGARIRKRIEKLRLEDFIPSKLGERVLSCGEGEQLGHPGRTTTKKPRAISTFPADLKFVQVLAGGVHSLILAENGTVYSCGINEKGTVPVKGLALEETTDSFTEIQFPPGFEVHGKIVQLAAGASFSSALTDKGSVLVWGNLRDDQGAVTVHELLGRMQKEPIVIMHHQVKSIVKVAAGENHLVMLTNDGELLTFGEGSHGQLGRTARTTHIRSQYMADEKSLKVPSILERGRIVRFVDIFAGGYWTMAKAEDGRLFACGLNNYGQLGIPLPPVEMQEDADPTQQEDADFRITRLTHAAAFPKDKNWTHVAGVKHILCRNDEGNVFGIGLNIDNILGLGSWTGQNDNDHWRYSTLQQLQLDSKVAGVDATLGASMIWTEDGNVLSFGCDTTGLLGLGLKDEEDDKVVPTPRAVTSAHLDEYRVIGLSIADQHALFLAEKKQ